MNNLLLILLSVSLGSIGQVILKLGANKLDKVEVVPMSVSTILNFIWAVLKIPDIIIGLFFFGSSFLLWVKVLTNNDLSYAYPMVSLGYILVAVLSYILFNESFTPGKILGIIVIVIGVFLVNR